MIEGMHSLEQIEARRKALEARAVVISNEIRVVWKEKEQNPTGCLWATELLTGLFRELDEMRRRVESIDEYLLLYILLGEWSDDP